MSDVRLAPCPFCGSAYAHSVADGRRLRCYSTVEGALRYCAEWDARNGIDGDYDLESAARAFGGHIDRLIGSVKE